MKADKIEFDRESAGSEMENRSPMFSLLVDESLSVRAKHILNRLGIGDMESLSELSRDELLATRHCGKKTAKEILKLAKDVKAGKYGSSPEFSKKVRSWDCFPPNVRDKAFNAVVGGLGCRAACLLERQGVETIDDFISLSSLEILPERGVGDVTIEEMQTMRRIVINFMRECERIDEADRLHELCRRIFAETISATEAWMLDPERPYESFLKWTDAVVKGRERPAKAFLMRMGLNGERAATLEKAGQRLGITRERVRQLNIEFKEAAKWEIHQHRFEPIFDRFAELVEAGNGRVDIMELFNAVAESRKAFQNLSYATPFLKYLCSTRTGREYGFKIEGNSLAIGRDE